MSHRHATLLHQESDDCFSNEPQGSRMYCNRPPLLLGSLYSLESGVRYLGKLLGALRLSQIIVFALDWLCLKLVLLIVELLGLLRWVVA